MGNLLAPRGSEEKEKMDVDTAKLEDGKGQSDAPSQAVPAEGADAAGKPTETGADPIVALRYHVVHGNEEKVRELAQAGADVNTPDNGEAVVRAGCGLRSRQERGP
jgi:hypothetical protein